MINTIAHDLGLHQFTEEQISEYECRVIYSALSCWIKTIALDQSFVNEEIDVKGVSRRHIYERSHKFLDTMKKMFPQTADWFDQLDGNEDAIKLIRTRLINHGDLINQGFDTNLALSHQRAEQTSSEFETVFGVLFDEAIEYTGVSAIRRKEAKPMTLVDENSVTCFQSYIGNACWIRNTLGSNHLQFFNPLCRSKNNHEAWQDLICSADDSVILLRLATDKNRFIYYFLKPKEQVINRIDPFLQEQGFHIRAMYVLRSLHDNKSEVKLYKYDDHVKIKLSAFLPSKEKSVIESYAWPVKSIFDKLEWIMEEKVWDMIRVYLEALDVHIVEENHG